MVNLVGSCASRGPAWVTGPARVYAEGTGGASGTGDAPGAGDGSGPGGAVRAGGASATEGGSDPALPPVPTAPGARLPPLPVVVEAARPSKEGVVELDRGLTWVRLRAGDSAQPEIVLRNGSRLALTVELNVVALGAGDGGRPVPADPPPGGPSAAGWVLLPTSRLQLAPSEQARILPSVLVPPATPSGGYAAGIRALARPQEGCADCPTARPGQEPTSLLSILLMEVVGRQGPPTQPLEADAALLTRAPSQATALVRLMSPPGRSRSVSGRLVVRSWWGQRLVEASLPPAVVLGGATREQSVGFRAPSVPGPYRLEVDLTAADGERLDLTTTAWLWNPLAGLIAVALVGVLLLGILRRRSS